MEVFFNELSVKIANDETQAEQWLIQLAELVRVLKKIVDELSDDGFAFRRSEDFAEQAITSSLNIREFLTEHFESSDPVVIFLYGIFDSPYISESDPLHTQFELSSLLFQNQELEKSGLIAAYLKSSLTISLISDPQWDTCEVEAQIKRLNKDLTEVIEEALIKNASVKRQLVDCHWGLLANVFNWDIYRPKFDFKTKEQNILHFMPIYSLILEEENWDFFYHRLARMSPEESVKLIKTIASDIAILHKWELASGTIANSNGNRVIYTIPNSSLIVTLDTQHGEFEIHRNTKGNNHLGAISFAGKMKPPVPGRSLNV